MDNISFTVVIVTFNRLECLKKALDCYSLQTYKPNNVIVVNNASTDNTRAFLDEWKTRPDKYNKTVINNSKNLGGAGGFAIGVDAARKTGDDFVFLADDDAYADRDALKRLNEYYKSCDDSDEISALCTSVINCGVYDYIHRRRVKRGWLSIKRCLTTEEDYLRHVFSIDEFSFVGVAIRSTVINKVGLPKADYFIYYDDTEYSHRVGQCGHIICVPASVMNHNVASGHDDNDVTWRSYYSLRNSLDVLLQYYPKRYFYCEAVFQYLRRCTIITRVIKHRNKAQSQLLKDAISDAHKGNIGLSDKYYPGIRLELSKVK